MFRGKGLRTRRLPEMVSEMNTDKAVDEWECQILLARPFHNPDLWRVPSAQHNIQEDRSLDRAKGRI